MDAPRTITARKPRRLRTILTTALITGALVAPTSAVAASGLFDTGDGVLVKDSVTGQVVEGTIANGQWVLKPRAAEPTTPPPTTAPPTQAPASADLKVTRSADGTTASASWNRAITAAVVGRDGRDSTGYGAWTSAPGVAQPAVFRQLVPGSAYKITVSGQLDGKAITQTVEVAAVTTAPPTSTPPTSPPVTSPPPTQATGFPALQTGSLGWISGAAGESVAGGQFAAYRGTPVRIAATWLGDGDADSTFRKGGEYGAFKGSLDVGYRGVTSPGQWASCATGACDARWRADLTKMKAAWESTDRGDGAFFLRLGWEMNGSWFQHSVNGSDAKSFAAGWARFSELRKEVFPAAKMVYSLNRDTSPSRYDWRLAVPGYVAGQAGTVARYVDVMNVDYYSEYASKADSVADFNADALKVDGYGAPVGIERHRQFAQQVGLPFSVGEWSTVLEGDQSSGDNPALIEGMHAFFTKNAGAGPGQLLYEVQFSVKGAANGKFVLGPNTRMPVSSAAYARLF